MVLTDSFVLSECPPIPTVCYLTEEIQKHIDTKMSHPLYHQVLDKDHLLKLFSSQRQSTALMNSAKKRNQQGK